jgi:putative redox protein
MATLDGGVTAASSAAATADGEAGWTVVRNTGPGFRTEIVARTHRLVGDEPVAVSGTDAGPTPYEYLLTALGSCTAMTIRMYAGRHSWPLDEVVVHLRHARSHEVDCESCDKATVGIPAVERKIDLVGALSDEQKKRLLDVADRCPVRQTLQAGLRIV